MSKPKKYKMRPTRTKPDGSFQMVPIGFVNGHRSALAGEGEHEVTPAIHRAYMAGDVDIDGYPYERPGAPKPAPKKRKRKAPETPKPEATEAEAKPETETEKES